ncbi:hypothetical protein CRENBAI_010454 [Crenichthys baileyi]|uniref:Uncharacterized protein n=1 Tax=Crenichthys baileyi TaxID=28760 RepID=A0AAV9RUE4_9TELE
MMIPTDPEAASMWPLTRAWTENLQLLDCCFQIWIKDWCGLQESASRIHSDVSLCSDGLNVAPGTLPSRDNQNQHLLQMVIEAQNRYLGSDSQRRWRFTWSKEENFYMFIKSVECVI